MQLRKIGILFLVLVMALTLSMPAFAATGYGHGTVGSSEPYTPPVYLGDSPATSGSAGASVGSGATGISNVAEQALAAATGDTATVSLTNVTSVSAAALQDVFTQAAAADKTATVNVDTRVGNVITARIYVDEAIAAALAGTVDLSVSVDPADTAATADFFKNYFTNEVAVVHLGQQGAYGANIPMAVKLDLSALNIETLVFIAYNKATNTYAQIPAANYRVDDAGYLYFTTPVGGEIVISDAPLARK